MAVTLIRRATKQDRIAARKCCQICTSDDATAAWNT